MLCQNPVASLEQLSSLPKNCMVQTANLPDLQQIKALTTAGGAALKMSLMKVIVVESIA
jgi:hypothetical protein